MALGVAELIGTAAGVGTGLIQTGIGIADRIKGKKKLKEAQDFYEKNKYQIPEAAKSALGVAERQAQGFRLPGEDIRRAQIAEATAGGLGATQQAATSASDVLSSISSLYGQQMQAEQNMGITGAERFDRNQQVLQSELGRMADLEREKWQYNSLYPYQQMLGQAEALQSRGTAELNAGLSAVGGAAGTYSQLSSAESQNQQFMQRMGLGNQSPYAGMTNSQKVQMMGAQDQLQQSRQGLYGLDNINLPQPKLW